MSTNKHNNKIQSSQDRYTIRNALVNYYLLLMFTVFPLFVNFYVNISFPFIHFDNGYFSIRHDKYYIFLIFTGLALIAEFLLILTYTEKNKKQKTVESKNDPLNDISFTDWAVIAFLVSCIISTLLSSHFDASVWGTSGRNNGLLLMIFYVGAYFLITRFFRYKEYVLICLAAASGIVYLLSILNSFYIDPLGMYNKFTDQETIDTFTSTIGNKNLLSSYICVTLPVFITMSVHTKKLVNRIVYLAASAIGFMSLMTADSDSGILGFGAFLVIYFIYYSRKIARLKKYFLSLAIMLVSAKVLRLFSYLMDDKSKGFDQFQEIFVFSNIGYILIAITIAITILLYFIDYKKPDIILTKAVPITLAILLAVAVIAIIGIVVYFSYFDTTTNLGSLERTLRFNDKWGTHRGYMWIRSLWIFGDASFFDKLFGTGPDTFYFAFSPYFSGLIKYGDSSTNAAHNEYLNYLITIGIAGLASYLAVIGGAVTRAVKTACKNPVAIVFASAVICYSVQAVVNISQPITTPLFIIFIALCEAVGRAD